MQHSKRLSTSRQVRVVLLSYLTRPGLRWALAALLAGLACCGSAFAITSAQHRYGPEGQVLTSILLVLGAIGSACAAAAMIFVMLLHAREQFLGIGARTFPQNRTANLIVGGVLLLVVAFLLTAVATMPRQPKLGIFVLWFGVLILASYATLRLWLIPVIVIGGFIALENRTVAWNLDRLIYGEPSYARYDMDSPEAMDPLDPEINLIRQRLSKEDGDFLIAQRRDVLWLQREFWHQRQETVQVAQVAVLFAELLAFVGLAKVAQPSRRSMTVLKRLVRPRTREGSPAGPVRQQAHTFIRSRLSRSIHRRFAVHDWRAAGVAAIGMGALSLWFLLMFRVEIAAPMLTLMLALLPGALVAIGWRERWPTFEVESLYPVSRHELATDMAAGLMLDVAEFWIASVIPPVVLCTILRVQAIHDARFWAAIATGGMMQFIWLAGIFLVGQWRQTVSYIFGLIPVALTIFLQFDALWRVNSPWQPRVTLAIAALEWVVSLLIFLITWTYLQRSPQPSDTRAMQPAI